MDNDVAASVTLCQDGPLLIRGDFEILDAHWDLPVKTVDIDMKP